MKAATAIALAAAVGAFARPAAAVEREHHLGVDTGVATLVVRDKPSPDVGVGFGAHWTYGLSDTFDLMVEGGWSLLALGESGSGPSTPPTRPATAGNADVGVAYVFDVLRWVPYAGVLAGGYALTGGTIGGVRLMPGLAAAGGLDYRFGRGWAAGVGLRWHFLVTDLATYPSFTTVFARVEHTWGW